MSITVNTEGKVGRIRKTIGVETNDPASPHARMILYVYVDIPSHRMSVEAGGLFKGKCGECHAKPAGSLVDEPLFEAVCSQCHGHYGLGGSAVRINDLDYLERAGNCSGWSGTSSLRSKRTHPTKPPPTG